MRPAPAGEEVNRAEWPYRMKDLCDQTGLERQAIHFYIQQGLLPEGHKTGRNMAYYGESHLARLKLIRQLQDERFLPLKAIRAVLDETDDGFTAQQRALLLDVKHRLAPVLGARSAGGEVTLVEVSEVRLRTGASKKDVDEMVAHGILSVTRRKGKTWIAKDDVWILEIWREMEELGFSRALGFAPADMLVFIDAMNGMFQREASMLKERLAHLAPEQVAPMVERSIPIINRFMARYHDALVRSFFASVQPEGAKERE
jgi:DNA-binding transcriptional MerR regulator